MNQYYTENPKTYMKDKKSSNRNLGRDPEICNYSAFFNVLKYALPIMITHGIPLVSKKK